MRTRIDFKATATAAEFNKLRDKWRAAASSSKANRAGLRVATVLPGFVNRELGYAFPTDEDLFTALECDKKTVQRGLTSLEKVGLIEREDMPKRNDAGRMIGKLRRIYLTLPEAAAQAEPKGQNTEGTTAPPKGQKQPTEGTDGVVYIPYKNTLDKDSTHMGIKVSSYACAREGRPTVCRDDFFLDTFDRVVLEMTEGREIGAGELDRIVREAFDRTAKLDTEATEAAPIDWQVVRDFQQRETENWFRARTGQLIHKRAA